MANNNAPIPPIPHDDEPAFAWVLEHVIGLDTVLKRNRVLVTADVKTAQQLLTVPIDDLIELLTDNTSLRSKTKLRALRYWAKEQQDVFGVINIHDFTEEVCLEKQEVVADGKASSTTTDKGSTTKSDKVPRFNGKREHWIRAKRDLFAYLNQLKSASGIPLYYVLRDPAQEDQYRNDLGELGNMIYDAPLQGKKYTADAWEVLQVLRQWTSGGTATTYTDTSNKAQDAWMALVANFEGNDSLNSNVERARAIIRDSTWSRNTNNWHFDDYCNRHQQANNDLDRYGENVKGTSQVTSFLHGIKCDNRQSYLNTIKVQINGNAEQRSNLNAAIIAFKDHLQQFFHTSGEKDSRHIGSMNSNRGGRGGRGGRNGGRNGGRGVRGNNGGRGYNNGRGNGGRGNSNNTNNTNNDFYIPDRYLQNIPKKYQAMMFKGRELMEKEANSDNNNKGNNDGRSVARVEILDDGEATTVTSNKKKKNDDDDDDDGGASSRFGTTGRQQRRRINGVNSTDRRISKATIKVNVPSDYSVRARAEIDTRADTLCAGSTFILHESTGKVVDVSGFHDTYSAITDIQVGTCITAIDLEGETIIASFPQSLYFGDSMVHSLIPPAQLWDYGLTVDVVPKQYTDGMSLHGIHHPDDDIFIPFHLHGCISYFSTRLPTATEINECRWITFTSEREWEPYSDHFAESERAMISHTTNQRYPDPRHLHYNKEGEQLDGRYIKSMSTVENIDNKNNFLHTFDSLYTRFIRATSSTTHRSSVPHDVLAKRWGTSMSTVKETVQNTFQRGVRYLQGTLSRRFRTRQKQLSTNYLRTNVYTDTMFKDKTSVRGNTCVQIFVTSEGFVAGKCMKSKGDAYEILDWFCREYGVPQLLVSDNAKEETLGAWGRVVKHFLIQQRVTEPYSSWQNRCEDEIREVRKHYSRIMAINRCPEAFWDFGMEYVLRLRQFLVRAAADGRSPIETITGETPDTSEFMDFDFFSWVKYRDTHEDRDEPIHLGRWLGISHEVGSPLTYWVLRQNGQITAKSTVRPLTPEEWKDEVNKNHRGEFDQSIKEIYGTYDASILNVFDNDDIADTIAAGELAEGFDGDAHNIGDTATSAAISDNTEVTETIRGPDLFQNAELFLPHGDRNETAKVIGRKRDHDGNYIGRAHQNPVLDSRIFTVRFNDGEEKDISYNILAEHLYSQVDSEGNQYRIFREIINHRSNKRAVDKADMYRIVNGKRIMKQTTAGWDFEVEWKDGSTSWIPLKELKETNAVDVATYAKENRIIEEPAFAWWAPHILKKLHRLIKLTKSRQVRRGYKFGIRVPQTVKEALQLDKENGDTLWYDAIMKEMGNVRIAFETLPKDSKPPPGFKHVALMMVFDIKMDFTRKARLVARGDQTAPPSTLTYSSVVSRESVRIAFLIAALNDLDVMMFDVGNAYLNAKTTEKLYTIAGIEFGAEEEGCILIIRRALYGLKSSGAAYRAHFAATLIELGFTSCRADPDVWLRPATKVNGFQYYEYLLTYVDDCLVLSEKPQAIIDTLQNDHGYRLKDVGPPTRYLGAEIGKYDHGDGTSSWYMSSRLYLKQAIAEVERKWGDLHKMFTRGSLDIPMLPGSHPELDTTKFLDDNDTQLYQSYVGIIRWAIELGRIDLAFSGGVMARFSAAPRQGHMQDILRIFAYCKKHIDSKVVFEAKRRDFSDVDWATYDWRQFYPDIVGEFFPSGQPKPRGNEMDISIFCDAAHATCHTTRRSTTGIMTFINGAPINWYSKRQNTIESSTFGSEFVALRIATEMNEALRYKLRMMGVPIVGASNCFCDNQSVVTNAILPHSTLSKKHNSVAYHKVRESVAMGIIRIAHEKGKHNLSDCLTKFLASPAFRKCIQCILTR
jgi:Reverse transcriptase (RNA-dependent DNA polymerase)